MLKIKDLTVSKELDSKAMAAVVGGFDLRSLLLDGSVSTDNKVGDVTQFFALGLDQANAGAVTNNQMIKNGNGITYAPVTQRLDQNNYLTLFGLGETRIK